MSLPSVSWRPAKGVGGAAGAAPAAASGRAGLVARISEIRLPELLLGLSLPWWRVQALPGMPAEIAFMAITIAICAFVRPRRSIRGGSWIALAYFAMLAQVIVVSLYFGQEWTTRSFRLLLLFLFAMAIAEGRLHWKSVLAGATFGLLFLNLPAYYMGLTPDKYPPYLTGFLVDKNVAGMYYAVFAVLGLSSFKSKLSQALFFCAMFGAVFLTGSRTSISAAAVGLAWWLIRNRVGLTFRLTFFGFAIFLLKYVEEHFSQIGMFADRDGSDWLRDQIGIATQAKLDVTPWFGQGLNTAWVSVTRFPHMWFHDSYASLRVEGGVPMLITMLVLVVVVALGLLSRKKTVNKNLLAAEAGIIVILVCAWKLGEVFFTAPTFLLLGAAIYERLTSPIGSPGLSVGAEG